MNVIGPGSTVGVLGSGQLGRMFAMAARKMGYRVHTFSPDTESPTGQVADLEIVAPYEDLQAVRRFAQGVDVVTFEFENVPAETSRAAAEVAPVRPDGHVLYTTQNRIREKTALTNAGFPVAPFATVTSAAELTIALQKLGTPCVLKTAGWGYDGKGQLKIHSLAEADAAWISMATSEAVLEAFVDFHCEVSVVAARGIHGETADFGVFANEHQHHILDVAVAPAPIDSSVAHDATNMARAIMQELDVVGVLCVEFFLTHNGKLIVNELAPRPHNSGHLTFDACITSQFEQQLRAICGLPLGSTELLRPAAMANLLGDLWYHQSPNGILPREPNWAACCSWPEVKLHLYGKSPPRLGRKMGHLTALASSVDEARHRVIAARTALTGGDWVTATGNGRHKTN